MKKFCKTPGCKSQLTDPTKGYCSRHIYYMERLSDTTKWLRDMYEIEKLEEQIEEYIKHSTDISE